MNRTLSVLALLICLLTSVATTRAQGPDHHGEAFALPPDLMRLLNAEMREITSGVQKIPVAIAQADWEVLHQTGESIRSSYIMAKALTEEQVKILESSLPERFKQLDSEFHARAGSLAQAAQARDIELVSFHYSRLIEGCANCHSLYAKTRFPGFGPVEEHGHQH
ncbi:MAG: cytochrome c [Xanthomonadales bacterium]|nr:cytochrome c [Xanthomonadales bacterium]